MESSALSSLELDSSEEKLSYDLDDDDDPSFVVLDLGSSMVRAGFENRPEPDLFMPNVVGVPRGGAAAGSRRVYVGSETIYKADSLRLTYPIERGRITHWDEMEMVLNFIFTDSVHGSGARSAKATPRTSYRRSAFPSSPPADIRADIAGKPAIRRHGSVTAHHFSSRTLTGLIGDNIDDFKVVMSETSLTPPKDREKLVTLMFETFNIASLCLSSQSVLALSSMGRTNGLVLCCGHGVTECVPVYEGHMLSSSVRSVPIAGSDVSYYLLKHLRLRYESLFEASGGMSEVQTKFTIHDIKRQCCYVAHDFPTETAMFEGSISAFKQNFKLPDGHIISITSERIRAPEVLFEPTLASKSRMTALKGKGMHNLIRSAVDCSPTELRLELLQNIWLSGGSSELIGIEGRLAKELNAFYKLGSRIPKPKKVRKPAIAAWIGGAILAKTSTVDTVSVSKDEYDETGPSVVNRKCF